MLPIAVWTLGVLLSRCHVRALQVETHPTSRSKHSNWTNKQSRVHELVPTADEAEFATGRVGRGKQAPPTLPPDIVTGAPTNAAEATGVAGNGAEDGAIFISGLIANCVVMIICMVIFMNLRHRYPNIYANNILTGIAPTRALGSTPEEVDEALYSRWGWLSGSWGTTVEDIGDTLSLDSAMLMEFAELGTSILMKIGVPMIFIVGPINCAFGGQPAWAIGDYLSSLSFGNVENGSALYWMHAAVVWYVVITVQSSIYAAQKRFLGLRFRWLHQLPERRANTVLVEGIPDSCRTDDSLKEFFVNIFGRANVKDASVVKDTSVLAPLMKRNADATQGLKAARAQFEAAGAGDDARPRSFWKGDHIEFYEKEIEETTAEIATARQKILEEQGTAAGVNTWCGFVTFENRRTAHMALAEYYSEDRDEWELSTPPSPTDLIWTDLQKDPHKGRIAGALGTAAIVGLYFAYMPLVLWIDRLATALDLGPLQSLWAALAPTMGLQIMLGFLPTFLLMIMAHSFNLKAEVYAQKFMQNQYFWFMIVFLVLVTAIGASVAEFTLTLVSDPLSLPALLGNTLPSATHFYMNFLVLQWVTHAMNLMRHVMLGKYKSFSVLFEDEEARKMAEPEDQDYYGIGSRSARFTINLVIGVVFGTLSPPINFLAGVNFFVCRVVYGYLIPFAECKKADLGGRFWVDQLRHLFIGNIIYCIVMIGVLQGRAEMTGFVQPATLIIPSLFYVIWSMKRFETAFAWEELTITDVVAQETGDIKHRSMEGLYIQPELVAPNAPVA